MNIRGILLAPVGAVVGLVAGLIIGGLGELVGLPGNFEPIVWALCAIAGGYLAFVGAVRMKVLFSLALGVVVLLVCAAVILSRLEYSSALMTPPLTTIELRQMLEKCSCEPGIQADVDRFLFSRLGEERPSDEFGLPIINRPIDSPGRPRSGPSWQGFNDKDLSTAPALARFGNTLSNHTWEIVPRDYLEFGMPSHVRVRFGQHFHYQYLLFFRTGADPSSVMSSDQRYEHVTGNLYFKPGKPYVPKR